MALRRALVGGQGGQGGAAGDVGAGVSANGAAGGDGETLRRRRGPGRRDLQRDGHGVDHEFNNRDPERFRRCRRCGR